MSKKKNNKELEDARAKDAKLLEDLRNKLDNKSDFTYKDILDLLDLTANSTRDDNILIKGNKKLENARAKDVKMLEDALFESLAKSDLFRNGIKYIRKYEHMYKHLENVKKEE